MAKVVVVNGVTLDGVMGRRTYEDFCAVWLERMDNPYTERLNKSQKYMASNTLKEPLPWANSTLLHSDVPAAVAKLKSDLNGNLTILGSEELIHSLILQNLIDECLLSIYPLVLGSGRRLFPDGAPIALRLGESITTTNGVIIATYQEQQARSKPYSLQFPRPAVGAPASGRCRCACCGHCEGCQRVRSTGA